MVAEIHHYAVFIEEQEIRDTASRVETLVDVLSFFVGKGEVDAGKIETRNDVFPAFGFAVQPQVNKHDGFAGKFFV